jgi:hypothetical protein
VLLLAQEHVASDTPMKLKSDSQDQDGIIRLPRLVDESKLTMILDPLSVNLALIIVGAAGNDSLDRI